MIVLLPLYHDRVTFPILWKSYFPYLMKELLSLSFERVTFPIFWESYFPCLMKELLSLSYERVTFPIFWESYFPCLMTGYFPCLQNLPCTTAECPPPPVIDLILLVTGWLNREQLEDSGKVISLGRIWSSWFPCPSCP